MEHTPDRGRTAPSIDTAYDAVLFDMDGVVTATAALHADAWAELFDSVLSDPRTETDGADRRPFDPAADYRSYVDGRVREDGVRAFLDSRNIRIPPGGPGDSPETWTVHGLAARKNQLFQSIVAERGVRVYPGTLDLLTRLRTAGIPAALVTASRNARAVLAAGGVADLFDVIVDGEVAAENSLAGKPDPASYLEAARRLGVRPELAVVIEDAIAGVTAGRRGGFGLVVGIDRDGARQQLEDAGADLVVGDVGELDLGSSRTDPWGLAYVGFDRAHEGHREALTALANGYLGTRGAHPEKHDDGVHYPGTYLAGVYNRVDVSVHGQPLAEEHLVNVPNWLPVDVRIGAGPWWSSGELSVSGERSELDLRRGVLTRFGTIVGSLGQRLEFVQRSFASMDDPHLLAMETTITAHEWGGAVTVRAGIDAAVTNNNVTRTSAASTHLAAPVFTSPSEETILCEVATTQSAILIATAVRITLTGSGLPEVGRRLLVEAGESSHEFEFLLTDGVPVTLTKTAAYVTSRDPAISSPGQSALDHLQRAGDFSHLLARHASVWHDLWDLFGITIDADRSSQLILNLHIFHTLQTISPHTMLQDSGVPARGLHGEGYRGHVFWDELFVMPVIALREPRVTRSLLSYRWLRLDAARSAARAAGLAGALFPWQSGSDGREETPDRFFNPNSSRWMPDNSHRQRHSGLAVAYNAWQQFLTTGDREWLAERGGELVIEVARLFASLAHFEAADGRFHIDGVMGPDEYHDGYPDSPGGGVRDNAYTNVLAAWVLDRARDVLDELRGHRGDQFASRLGIADDEVEHWARLSSGLAVPFHADGVISQFDGYENLAEFDWIGYRRRYGNIERLDLILEAEGDTTNRYKLSKQADVLMLFYLLGNDGLSEQLSRLAYTVSDQELRATLDYYSSRTSHGSTLSRVVAASVWAGYDESRSWQMFREALVADLDDTQGGTTREGIHLGAMAGTTDLVMRSFAGLRLRGDELIFDPRLPPHVSRLTFQVHYREQLIEVTLNHQKLRVDLRPSRAAAVRVRVGDTSVLLAGDEGMTFPLHPGSPSASVVQ